MKRILYLVPLILLGSCKQTKFICNQQLVLQQQTLAAASPDTSKIEGKDNIRAQYETEVNAVKPISSEKKMSPISPISPINHVKYLIDFYQKSIIPKIL